MNCGLLIPIAGRTGMGSGMEVTTNKKFFSATGAVEAAASLYLS